MTWTPLKMLHSIGDILKKILWKLELNQTDGSRYIAIFLYTPCHSDLTARFFWTMLVPTPSATSLASTPVLSQAPVNVLLPTYDWNVADQMQEFCLFKCQLETWFRLFKIKAEECLDYLLCILGKEGYVAMDHWVPLNENHKGNPEKFLNYIESTLDDEISPWVHVYELEDVKKRSDESVDEVINRICQLICHVQIGNGHDAAIEFEVQCRLIWAIPDGNIELQKELLKVNHDKKYLTYWRSVAHIMPLDQGQLQCVLARPSMPSAKAVNLRRASRRSVPHSAKTAPTHTLLAVTTVLHGMPPAMAVPKEATGTQSAAALVLQANTLLNLMELWRPHHQHREKGKRADIVQVSTKETPPYDELFANTVNCGSAGDTHPEEIVIDDICAPRCNKAYTTVKLPASISSKGTASLHVKVDTGAGGNVLPFLVFWHLHPDWISPAGLPTGLDHVSTRLTTYNGSHIPLYGALHGPIVWQQGGPGIQPYKINSYWYIADTPSPAILGLPSCRRLAIVKMNCVVTVMQPGTKPPSPAPASTTATKVKPATVPTAAKSIRSTDNLIKEFPDWFTVIGRFPGKYKIQLQHDVHSMIHTHRKCPIILHLKVKEHLDKIECLGVITHIDEPKDWVSSITYIQKAKCL